MVKYEKQLSVLILQKLPRIIQVTVHDINDQEYLFYHLDQLMKQISENIQDFRLQPLSMYSDSSEIMTIKLITLRKLISKSRHIFYSEEGSSEEQSQIMNSSLKAVKEKLDETEVSLQQLQALEEDIASYNHIKEHGSFW